jgi:hypothetical protein
MYVRHNNSGAISLSFTRGFKFIIILINRENQAEGAMPCSIKFDAD